jgi:multiple sugar transport system substrate-binding protein
MKRALAFTFSLLLIASFLITSCAAPVAQPAAAPTQVSEPAKPVEPSKAAPTAPEQTSNANAAVTLNAIGFESCITDGLKKQAEAYMKENPNVKVNVEATAYTNLHEKQVVELSGGTGAYDVYSVVTDWMPEYMAAGFLEPLDDYMAKSQPVDWPNTWTKGLLKFVTHTDNKVYGLPHHDGPQLLYYRKDLFEDAKNQADFKAKYGYDLEPPTTWQQFLDIATFFTDPAKDMWGTVLTAKFGEQQLAHDFWLLLPGFGGGAGFDDNGNPSFNGAEGVNALQFYADLIKKHKVAPEASLTFGIPEAGDFYLSGKAAMHWNWSHIGAYAEMPENSKIVGKNGFTVMPLDEGKGQHAIYGSYWILGIDTNSKNKQAAYDFIKYATGPTADKLLADVGCIPSRLSSWNDPDLLKKYPFYAVFQPSYEGFVTSSPRVPEYEKLNDLMQRYLSKAISGETTAQEALDSAAKEMTGVLKEAGRIK